MGYYSQTVLVLSSKGDLEMQEKLSDRSAELREFFQNCPCREVDDESGAVMYLWDSIKWYFTVCEEADDLINDLDPDEYLFMRLGEDFGDMEERGSLYDTYFNPHAETTLVVQHREKAPTKEGELRPEESERVPA